MEKEYYGRTFWMGRESRAEWNGDVSSIPDKIGNIQFEEKCNWIVFMGFELNGPRC
jgi:hypothetical protein